MKPEVEKALEAVEGFCERLSRYSSPSEALVVIRRALLDAAVDRTASEFLAADLVALAEGRPVKTDLAKAVERRIAFGAPIV